MRHARHCPHCGETVRRASQEVRWFPCDSGLFCNWGVWKRAEVP